MKKQDLLRVGLVALTALWTGVAQAEGEECTDDSMCADGESCSLTPCARPICPDGASCPEPPACEPSGICEDNNECSADADCAEGFTCEVVAGGGCPGSPPCIDGDCPPPPPCEEYEFSACVPAPCDSDADCGGDLVCIRVEYESCSGGGTISDPPCAPGERCEPPPPPEDPMCETIAEAYCGPRYVAPCDVDADCGDAFTCSETEVCACASPAPGPGEPADPPVEPDCTCEPSGDRYCEPNQIPCDGGDTACPDGWSCEVSPVPRPTCTFDPETGAEDCPPAPPTEAFCLPPYWNDGFGRNGRGVYDALAGATGEESARPTGLQNGPSTGTETVASSGCNAAPGNHPMGSWLALLGLIGLGVTLRRRTQK